MSIFAIISSDSSLKYFPQNKAYRFNCHLNTPLNLEGGWKVAVVEANISSRKALKVQKPLCVFSSIFEESIVDGDKKTLLRKVPTSLPNIWNAISEVGHYMPVKTHNISDIDIYITTRKGDLASFTKSI